MEQQNYNVSLCNGHRYYHKLKKIPLCAALLPNISFHSGSNWQLQRGSSSELIVSTYSTPYRPPLRLARFRALSQQQICHRIFFHNMALCPRGRHRCTYWRHRYPNWPNKLLRRGQDPVSRQALCILPLPPRLLDIHSDFLGIDEGLIFGC